jgi:hypothetical protein
MHDIGLSSDHLPEDNATGVGRELLWSSEELERVTALFSIFHKINMRMQAEAKKSTQGTKER